MSHTDTLTHVTNLWDSASIFTDQQIKQWAQNESLLNSRHLTARKPGRSRIFVPKIAGYHRRKMADFVGQFVGDTPVSIKNTITSSSVGAKIKQRVHNYLLYKYCNYDAVIYNGAYSGLAYNFAPVHIDWVEETVKTRVLQEDGSTITEETVVASYPVIDPIPPEAFRIDPSVSWDELDDSRYIGYHKFIDKAFAHDMHEQGKWPKISDEQFTADVTDMSSSASSMLKSERRSINSPFANQSIDEDNGLLEARWHYYFQLKNNEYIPVRTVTLSDNTILEDSVPLTINWGGDKHAWPFVLGQVYPKPFEQFAAALPEQAKDMQIEANAKRNQRVDNVNLILNPEKYVTPFAGVSADQLAFSFPGKVVTVDNLNAIQWQTVPDVTAAGHNEENRIEQDMDRLFSEGPLRAGMEGRRKESATAIQMMSSNASAATGLDTTLFMLTFVRPLNEKIGNAIAQKADESLFKAAADDLLVNPQAGIDPVLAATEGDFVYNVFASASQNELQAMISNNSNLMGIVQTAYGPNANYKPLIDDILELAGYDPDSIIQAPQQQDQVPDPAKMDMGGVDPGAAPSIQPRAQFQGGGAMGAGSGKQ